MIPSHIHKDTLVDNVTRELRHLIQVGEILPGEFLPPRKDLAAQFGVGLSTIQEAVQALAAVGMLDSHPGKGTWVREDALDTLIHPAAVKTQMGELNTRQIYEARSVIEVGLAELAAQRATAEDIARIWDALHAMEEASQDDETFVSTDLEFHLAVARAAHSELLEQFYHLSRKLLSELIAEIIKLPNVKENGIRIQRTIAQAIEKHDPQKARQATLDHMAVISDLLGE